MSKETTALFRACRKTYDALRQGDSAMDGEKQVGIINAFLGKELIMSLLIAPDGDVMILEMSGRSVHVYADPSRQPGVMGATQTEVVQFLRNVARRRRSRRHGGSHESHR